MSVRRRRLGEALAVAFASILGAVTLTWPSAAHPRSVITGSGGDAFGAVWWLWRSTHHGYAVLGTSRHTDLGAPFGWVEGNGVNMLWSVVSLPAYLVARIAGETAAYNVLIMFAIASAGAAMYWLLRRLGAGPAAAAWAGLVFTLFPWHMEKTLGHGALATIMLFPVLLWLGARWHERPTVPLGLAMGAVTLGMWLTSGYHGIVASVGVLAMVAVCAVPHRRALGMRVTAVTAVSAVAATGAAAAVTRVLVGLGNGPVDTLPVRNTVELEVYGARLQEFLTPSHRNILLGDRIGPWVLRHQHGSNVTESSLTLGWLTLGLALAFIVAGAARARYGPRGRYAGRVLPLIALVAVACALPSPLRVQGHALPMPATVIHDLVPSFRVPTRFMPLIIGALIPPAALMLDFLVRRAGAGTGRRWGAAAVAGLAMVVSTLELAPKLPQPSARIDRAPAVYTALDRTPRGVVAQYPLNPAVAPTNSGAMLWQRIHGRPLLNGALPGTFADTLRTSLVNPATPGVPETLAALGVTAVVVREEGPPDPSLQGLPGAHGLVRVADTASGSVWRVTATPAPAVVAFDRGFLNPEYPTPDATTRWMAPPSGHLLLYAPVARRVTARFTLGSYGPNRVVRLAGRTTATLTAPGPASLALDLPRGFSDLFVTTRPGAQPLPGGQLASISMSNWVMTPGGGPRAVAARPIPTPRDVVVLPGPVS